MILTGEMKITKLWSEPEYQGIYKRRRTILFHAKSNILNDMARMWFPYKYFSQVLKLPIAAAFWINCFTNAPSSSAKPSDRATCVMCCVANLKQNSWRDCAQRKRGEIIQKTWDVYNYMYMYPHHLKTHGQSHISLCQSINIRKYTIPNFSSTRKHARATHSMSAVYIYTAVPAPQRLPPTRAIKIYIRRAANTNHIIVCYM